MATESPYLDAAREALWARQSFSFIPDRDLPPPTTVVGPASGPRVAFAGFPSDYSLGFLLALLELDVQLCGIVTSPGAHPAILGDNALSRIGDHVGVPLVRAWRVNDEHSQLQLASLRAETIVMASFDQIVGAKALRIPPRGWMNIHPSLIPEYRGPEPVYWAIADGAARTGITLHRAAPKVDSGPILEQAEVVIGDTDTAGTLTRKLVAAGVELLPPAVDKLLTGVLGTPPDMSRSTYRPSVGHRLLESAASAREAERMVRAGMPNMPAWSRDEGSPVYVFSARVLDGPAHGPSIPYADGTLELLSTSGTCHCHHNLADCPHRRS